MGNYPSYAQANFVIRNCKHRQLKPIQAVVCKNWTA